MASVSPAADSWTASKSIIHTAALSPPHTHTLSLISRSSWPQTHVFLSIHSLLPPLQPCAESSHSTAPALSFVSVFFLFFFFCTTMLFVSRGEGRARRRSPHRPRSLVPPQPVHLSACAMTSEGRLSATALRLSRADNGLVAEGTTHHRHLAGWEV